MKFGNTVVKHRRIILIAALVLLIPSVLGVIATRINYDMLYYLPEDIETVQGQNVLLDEFGKGGFSIVVVEDMKSDDVSRMSKRIEEVDHVDSVIDLESILDPSIPRSMLPDIVNDSINNPDASMIVVFFDSSTSSEETLNAVSDIREILTKTSYISGMSSLVLDLKNLCEREEAKYVAVAVVMALAALSPVIPFRSEPPIFANKLLLVNIDSK